jgi:hypothetical protein
MADILQNKSKDWELNMWIFLLIYAYQREIGKEITCCTYLRTKYIIFNFHCHFIKYHSILFLNYVNMYAYPFPSTSFKIHKIGIPEALYVFGVKRWLKCYVSPSDIEHSYSITRHSSYSTSWTWITHFLLKKTLPL